MSREYFIAIELYSAIIIVFIWLLSSEIVTQLEL